MAKWAAEEINACYGVYFTNPEVSGHEVASYMINHGYFKPNGDLIDLPTMLQMLVNNEPDSNLREAYKLTVLNVQYGTSFVDFARQTLSAIQSSDPFVNTRASGVSNILAETNLSYMGIDVGTSVSGADAIGLNEGYWYGYNSGQDPLKWAFIFCVVFSEYVACRTM